MKLNWGAGIAIFYALFAVAMLSLVAATARQDIGLVSKDYYQADLAAQKLRDARLRAAALSPGLSVKNDAAAGQLLFLFPKNMGDPKGEIRFLRPSRAALDFVQKISVDSSGAMPVPTSSMAPGLWRVTVEWSADGQGYLVELPVTI